MRSRSRSPCQPSRTVPRRANPARRAADTSRARRRRRRLPPRALRQRPAHKPGGTARSAAQSNDACSIGCECRDRTKPFSIKPQPEESRSGSPGSGPKGSEFDLWDLLDGLAVFAEVKELFRVEAEAGRKQRGRELLDAGIVFTHCIVEEAASGGELVLDVAKLGLQLHEIR